MTTNCIWRKCFRDGQTCCPRAFFVSFVWMAALPTESRRLLDALEAMLDQEMFHPPELGSLDLGERLSFLLGHGATSPVQRLLHHYDACLGTTFLEHALRESCMQMVDNIYIQSAGADAPSRREILASLIVETFMETIQWLDENVMFYAMFPRTAPLRTSVPLRRTTATITEIEESPAAP